LHIGGLVDKDYVSKVVSKINSQHPDIILIGGDLIDTKLEYIQEELQILKELKSKYGVYFIVGNHEYFHNLEEIITTTKKLGLIPLLNETIHINDLDIQISGIYDYMGKRRDTFKPDLNALNIDKSKYSILVSHQPKVIEDKEFKEDNFDMILSGHTHCGQISPFGLLVLLDQPYLCGEYDISPRTKLLISAGAGFWGPQMRIGSNYEIHLLQIKGNYDIIKP
jgi:predicted MPP superfamily phosphohydrolase